MKPASERIQELKEREELQRDRKKAYHEKPLTLNELKELTNEEVGKATKQYFNQYPKKTVFKINNKIRIRKDTNRVNIFYLYTR